MTGPTVTPAHPSSGPAAPLTGLQGLHPGWFGAVMGTAVVGIAAYTTRATCRPCWAPRTSSGSPSWRWPRSWASGSARPTSPGGRATPGRPWPTCATPSSAPCTAPFPAACSSWPWRSRWSPPPWGSHGLVVAIVAVLAAVGTVLGFALSLTFAYLLFTGDIPGPLVNGGWFIPPVVTIIVPVALAPLVAHVHGSTARLLVALGYAFSGWGCCCSCWS